MFHVDRQEDLPKQFSINLMLNSNWIFQELAKYILKCIIQLTNSDIKSEKEQNEDSYPTRY